MTPISEENSAKISQNQAPESQGWVGIKTSPIGVRERLSEILKKDLYNGDLQGETSNIPAEENPHFTAVYGLTAQGMKGIREYLNEKIQTLSSVKIKNIDVFEPDRDYKVIVARLEKTADISNLHQELLERGHYDQEFPEYKPHITLCYVNKNANADKFLEAFRDLKGQTIKIIGYDLSYPEDTQENTTLIFREGLIPHQELLENSKKAETSEEVTLDSRLQESKHNHQECDCGKVEVLINELGEDGKTLEESYKKFLTDIESVQKETYKACVSKLTVNAFTEEDIIGERKKRNLTNKLKSIIQNYWWILTPLLANSLMKDRNEEFGENVKFVFTNELQNKVENNASRVAEGHMETILNDVLTASNRAYTEITERKAAELIIEAYKANQPKYVKYFEEQPSMTEALQAIRNTDILDENRKIYERANELAMQGYKREDIIKDIRARYNQLSEKRAEVIARNETSRAYSHSQYEADTQFLNSIGQLDTAYKELYSLRPENEKDKICPICEAIINQGPIPFTQNFVSLGETITTERDGKVYNFLCNYENIEGGTIHVNCFCRYRLILNGKTLNEVPDNGLDIDGPNDGRIDNNSFDSEAKTLNDTYDATGRKHDEKGRFTEKIGQVKEKDGAYHVVTGHTEGMFPIEETRIFDEKKDAEIFSGTLRAGAKSKTEASVEIRGRGREYWISYEFTDSAIPETGEYKTYSEAALAKEGFELGRQLSLRRGRKK